MDVRMIITLSVIVCLGLAAVSCENCQDLQGSCVDKGFQCSGNKIPGKCPKNELCCIEGEARCNVLGGICIGTDNDCAGVTIPGKCPGKHTCCIPDIPACTTPDYTYVEDFNTCIKFYNDTVNYADAQTRCVNEGGHLVVLDTVAKDNFILNYVRNITGGDPHTFWIGLFWISGGSETDWQWVTGQHVSTTFQNWLPGDPFAPSSFSCGSYSDRFKFANEVGWSTEFCSQTHTSVCEQYAVGL